ncbi:ankyrin repeat domain-containing protein 28 [Coprinopsis cinerea okayama7|uniref:Ankyrin repeat domain-containing protein 28 n=1 Tax=Coprinopsis cinerea (strain Okayama-7 / 130 / ATCC MYA-4618 / FGSC 9003) TaxID=240176 RepID=A8NBC5_COPC7|nr:ankyrin repeat domain-containing protein 28 [Coprinopsis cinerea okayama7\|eukprot:XP_001832124.2 ankyrin repeat domain-containing protein 28 [Coprinopsis cinerea okayama7\
MSGGLKFKHDQEQARKLRTEGTGTWILENATFRAWQDKPGMALWCQGKQLQGRYPNVPVLFVFIKHDKRCTIRNIASSLLRQLLRYREYTDSVLDLILEECTDAQEEDLEEYDPTDEELVSTLRKALALVPRAFITIDALDELDENLRPELVKPLLSLRKNTMITSRPLDTAGTSGPTLPAPLFLDIQARKEDISVFVENHPKLRTLLENHSPIMEKVKQRIQSVSEGMFLLAFWMVRILADSPSPRDVLNELDGLPNDLEEMYNSIWERICAQRSSRRQLAERILTFVIHANKPMTIPMLQHALAMREGLFDPDSIVTQGGTIVEVCHGLIMMDDVSEKQIVKLVPRRDDILQLLLTVPNLNYNARDANGDTPLHIASYQGRASWVEHLLRLPGVHVNAKDGSQNMKRRSGDSALTLAVKMDHLECVQLLLSHPELDVNEQDRSGVTALMEAASLSRLEATRLLLQHPRIDVNSKDGSGNTALWRAIPKGLSSSYYEDLIELLLNRPDLEREGLERPFIKAAALYHTRVIALFIKRGFDPRTSFMKAASKGNSAAMRIILDGTPGIDYGMHQDSRGETALFKTAASGHELATQLLLKRKVVPIGHKNHRGETALIQAAARGQDLCVGAILEHCDHHDVNSTNNAGQTPLIVAARSGWDRVVDRLLKDERVLVGHRTDTGGTAIDWAISGIAKWRQPEADTTPPASPTSGTRPRRSYNPSHSKVVSLLLDHPDIGSSLQPVEFRKHPLVAAIYNCQTDIVKALLSSSKCDPNVRDRKGQSILMKSAAQGFTDSLELLLSMPNIDVNAQDVYGATALMKAAYCNQKKSAQILLAHPGIDINLPQWNGKTALDIATRRGSVEIAEALKRRGGKKGGGGSLR